MFVFSNSSRIFNWFGCRITFHCSVSWTVRCSPTLYRFVYPSTKRPPEHLTSLSASCLQACFHSLLVFSTGSCLRLICSGWIMRILYKFYFVLAVPLVDLRTVAHPGGVPTGTDPHPNINNNNKAFQYIDFWQNNFF